MAGSLPVALGLCVCDYVIVEEKTRKASAIGMFSGMGLEHLPGRALPFSVFAALSDGLGVVTIRLVITRLDTGAQIFSRENQVNFMDKLTEVYFHFRVRTCVFPAAGWYEAVLLANGEWLAHRRFRVYPVGGVS